MVRTAPLSRAALFACCLFSSSLAAATESSTFRQALDAARNSDWTTLDQQQAQLGDTHPLQAYLDYHRLRTALPALDPDKLDDYQQRYADSPLPEDLRELAIAAYGKAARWEALLTVSPTPPGSIALQCYYYRAKLQQGDESALQEALRLWHHGGSRPNACDPLFEQAQDAEVINAKAIWERQLLAFDSNNSGMMRYLGKMLAGSPYQQASEWLQRLYRDPQQLNRVPSQIAPEQRQLLLAAGLRRLAYKDTVSARQWYEKDSRRQGLRDDELREAAAQRIAWYSTIRGSEDNRDWLDDWLKQHADGELLDQRARRTIIERDWPSANQWIARLPEQEQQDSRWLYWRARALEETEQADQARALYQQAAQQRNFFAFMAADRLGEPYRFGDLPYQAEGDFTPPPAVTRVAMLRELDEDFAATKEWWWLMNHSDEQQLQQLAQYALEQRWYDLAVQTSIKAKAWDNLAWRFPPAYQQEFEREAKPYKLDSWLVMAVSRRESAFNPRAHSPVGALGLMQLMPATARHVAKDANLPRPNRESLQQPQLNIALGSRYLADLLEEFNGNRILALAAYNAGPNRVHAWLDNEEALPADIWVEAIPFRETRDYVQAVLTYRALFVGLHDNQARTAQLLTEKESEELYSVSMLGN